LPASFKSFGPVLPDVKIVETWGYYDGPLFGVCEIEGIKFFFQDCIFDIWRHYSEEDGDRLWSIFAVFDVDVAEIRKISEKNTNRSEWMSKLEDGSEVIGIFWEYS